MKNNTDFDDIRPYYDSEIPAAMQRIVNSEFFPLMASYVYPERNIDEIKKQIIGFRTISDFQIEVMLCVSEQVISRSITDFTYDGIEQLNPNRKYLFVSNHRDIMLDSCLQQYILLKNGHETTEITFGSNLMNSPLIVDIGKSNKMFRVERGGKMKDFYMSSKHLSDYIRYVLTDKNQSVWIAQRNGRTKDGNDETDQGLIKMFCLSKPSDKIRALSELNIVPVSISYEWESCDILKSLELYESRYSKYVKKTGEDFNSVLTGLLQPKGNVHISFCNPITKDNLLQFYDCTNNEYNKKVATMIDKQIIGAYRLSPNNYIAHDLRYGQDTYSSEYTEKQKCDFLKYMEKLNAFDIGEPDVLKDIFLGIYSNPIENKKHVDELDIL